MEQYSYFHGKLEFTRKLSEKELHSLQKVLGAYRPLTISDDERGLVYCSEKTYSMIQELNQIIKDARKAIPDFGLKGELAAETEFEPGLWFVKIGDDGLAFAEPTTRIEFLAFRRTFYRGFPMLVGSPVNDLGGVLLVPWALRAVQHLRSVVPHISYERIGRGHLHVLRLKRPHEIDGRLLSDFSRKPPVVVSRVKTHRHPGVDL